MSKISLTEATILALQGKLTPEETNLTTMRKRKTESVDITDDNVSVSTDEAGNTTVETDRQIITVSQKTLETDTLDTDVEDEETRDEVRKTGK